MTATQLIINIAAGSIWLYCIAVLVHRWRTRNGKRPPGPEE
jgi:hypothetical protein